MAPEVDEPSRPGEAPEKLVERLAIQKAQKIAAQNPGALVIGSDQVAVYDGVIVGKPHNHDNAVRQLRSASGKTVTLYTGLALVNADTRRVQCEVIPYRVQFRARHDDTIESSLQRVERTASSGGGGPDGIGRRMSSRHAR